MCKSGLTKGIFRSKIEGLSRCLLRRKNMKCCPNRYKLKCKSVQDYQENIDARKKQFSNLEGDYLIAFWEEKVKELQGGEFYDSNLQMRS